MQTWVVLLRGINVGGKNVISMHDLRQLFSELGYIEPHTYIQSGNVVLGARSKPGSTGVKRIETALSEAFGYDATVVIRNLPTMRTVVRDIPADWDPADATMRYNVLFPVDGLSPAAVVSSVRPKPEVEAVVAGSHAVYWSAPFSTLRTTAMVKLSGNPVYKRLTIRNLATTTKLLGLMEAREES
jgi:uncharacterized protein (DUF1697 family)